jgi:hypothetical protein
MSQMFGTILAFSGVLLMGLSGLEKILVFTSFGNTTADIQSVIGLIPPYIWSITNVTFWFGLLFFIIGLSIVLWKFSAGFRSWFESFS